MPTALVTGANRGIGLALCQALKQRGDDVIAVCRHSSKELQSLGIRVEPDIELTSDEAVAKLADHVQGVALDTVILNAGVLGQDTLASVELDDVRTQFEVNALAPLRVAKALLPNLGKGAKLALMTSRMGSIGDNGSGGYYGYRMSKAALNAAGMSLARDLAKRGVAVAILHPGFVRTGMTGGTGNVEPADAARMLLARIDGLSMGNTGTFWHANGEQLPW